MSKMLEDILKVDSDDISKFEEEDSILEPLLSEIGLITDLGIKSFTRSILLRASTFWDIPASFIDTHPPDERKPGGNVLHTKRVIRMVGILCEAHDIDPLEKDIILAAALLHDLTKGMQLDGDAEVHYDPMHPYTVGKFVQVILSADQLWAKENQSSTLYIDGEVIEQILRVIRCHLGLNSPVPETIPATQLDSILHIANLCASNLHTIIDGDEIKEWRWLEPDERESGA